MLNDPACLGPRRTLCQFNVLALIRRTLAQDEDGFFTSSRAVLQLGTDSPTFDAFTSFLQGGLGHMQSEDDPYFGAGRGWRGMNAMGTPGPLDIWFEKRDH